MLLNGHLVQFLSMRVRVLKITYYEGDLKKTYKFGLALLMLDQSSTFIL